MAVGAAERERARERDAKWRCSTGGSFAWWLQRPEVVDGGRRVWWQWVQRRERGEEVAEAQARGRRRVREIRTLNKPYGFDC